MSTASETDIPRCVPAFDARVTIGEIIQIGHSKHGLRQLIPITGGSVEGPMLRGEVIPGGADWQLVRADGVLELDARYTIRAEDGAYIEVRNRGIWHGLSGDSYVRTVPQFAAPSDGPHAGLNHAIFLATAAISEPGAIALRFFKVV